MCCEFNQISNVGEFANVAIKDKSGVNLQKNLITDSQGFGVMAYGSSCGIRMEHNILLNCVVGVRMATGGEIFAEKNAFTCHTGFVAGGVLRGYFKSNYMAC